MTPARAGDTAAPADPTREYAGRGALKRAVAGWCLRNAARCVRDGALEPSAQWCENAGRTLDVGCEPLVSPALERQLVELAVRLPLPSVAPPGPGTRPRRWLHVLNEAYPHGGHTATVQRWIRMAPSHGKHSVVFLGQRTPIPPALTDAVAGSGGEVVRLDPDAPLLARAVQLRERAWSDADLVVLHVHPHDVLATLAFGVPGGPPVLFLNHAAHIFWTGAAVSDAVVNLWNSAAEDAWTRTHRGIERLLHLTIPLTEPEHAAGEPIRSPEVKRAARASLGLPADALVLLTMGTNYKFTPAPQLDFVATAVGILRACPDAHLVAVGVHEDARWNAAREATGGRISTVGPIPHEQTATYRAAADIYLEGFPFGSTTALLEAGMLGLACVRAPKTCPPPFAAGDVALGVIDSPEDASDYAARVIEFAGDLRERERIGHALAASVRAHHSGTGWIRYLEQLERDRPARHVVRVPPDDVAPVAPRLAEFWGAFAALAWPADPLGVAFRFAMTQGLRPRADAQLVREVRAARGGRGVAAPSAVAASRRAIAAHAARPHRSRELAPPARPTPRSTCPPRRAPCRWPRVPRAPRPASWCMAASPAAG